MDLQTHDEILLTLPVSQLPTEDVWVSVNAHFRDWTIGEKIPFTALDTFHIQTQALAQAMPSATLGALVGLGSFLGLTNSAQADVPYAQSSYVGPYSQGSYYAQGSYTVYSQGSYSAYSQSSYAGYNQSGYYAQSSYGYSQSGYYAQGSYAVYSQSSYTVYSQSGYYSQSSYTYSQSGYYSQGSYISQSAYQGTYTSTKSLVLTAEVNGEVTYLQTLFPRYIQASQEVVRIPREIIAKALGTVLTVRIKATKRHKVRSAFLFKGNSLTETDIVTTQSLPVKSVYHAREQKEVREVLSNPDQNFVHTLPGDVINVQLEDVPAIAGMDRHYVLKARGFYTQMSDEVRKEIGTTWYRKMDKEGRSLLKRLRAQKV